MRPTSSVDLTAEGLMTIPEACAFLSVSTRSVWRLMSGGSLPYVMIGGSRRIPRVAVKRLIALNIKI